jgi:hypothetical protein
MADAEQAWVETMAEIAAKENCADDEPVDGRVWFASSNRSRHVGRCFNRRKQHGVEDPAAVDDDGEDVGDAVNAASPSWATNSAGRTARLPDTDFDELIRRAQQQREELEPHRVRAGTEALLRPADNRSTYPTPCPRGSSPAIARVVAGV